MLIRGYHRLPQLDPPLVEGEEEVGSPNLGGTLERIAEIVTPDLVLIADGDALDGSRPYITASLRGLLDCTIEVETLTVPVHAGQFGGIVPDAFTALVRILASLLNADGTVAVAGLTRQPPTDIAAGANREAVQRLLLDGVQEIGRGSMADRLLSQPTVAVVAIDSSPVETATRSLANHARAMISLRVAPGDDPDRAFGAIVRHIEAVRPWGAHVDVQPVASALPYVTDLTTDIGESVIRSMGHAWGAPAAILGSGASIPFAPRIAAAFPGASTLITAVADQDSNAHGPDESVDVKLWRKAAVAEAFAIAELPSR